MGFEAMVSWMGISWDFEPTKIGFYQAKDGDDWVLVWSLNGHMDHMGDEDG